jgi:hypothetical protein
VNAEQAKKLREPFKPEQIGKLPRAANKAAKDANKKANCSVCGKYHVQPSIHLDYVSHAVITDRLIHEDPDWTWEPMAVDEHGVPVISNGGLWIKLTVFGKTLPGFGDAEGGRGIKEMIGDALRNGAMRFGIGLDLWIKEDSPEESKPVSSAPVVPVERPPAAPVPAQAGAASPPPKPGFQAPGGLGEKATPRQKQDVNDLIPRIAASWGVTEAVVRVRVRKEAGSSINDLTAVVAADLIPKMEGWIENPSPQQELGGGVK